MRYSFNRYQGCFFTRRRKKKNSFFIHPIDFFRKCVKNELSQGKKIRYLCTSFKKTPPIFDIIWLPWGVTTNSTALPILKFSINFDFTDSEGIYLGTKFGSKWLFIPTCGVLYHKHHKISSVFFPDISVFSDKAS